MPDITNYDGRLEQMACYCEAMLDNIAKVNNAYHDSVDVGYADTLPDHLIKWKGVKKIGGKTIVWNQLVNTGTATVSTISGHKYYTLIDGTASIVTADGTAISVVDDTADMVCDLTLMFGSGNEPATTSDFTAIFGATHYSYNAGTLLSAGVTDVVSKDTNNATLQTYSIPAEVQALEGYGWSVSDTVYNYIDFERKVFVKNVGQVTLDGSETWYYDWSNNVGWTIINDLYVIDITTEVDVWTLNNNPAMPDVAWRYRKTATSCFGNYWGENKLYAKDTSIVGSVDAKNYFTAHPTTVNYKLNTPVEIDISEYLTDENITKAESGGTITFPNQHGDDYKIPVPAKLEYIGV